MENVDQKQKLIQLLRKAEAYIEELMPVIKDEWQKCKEGIKSDFEESVKNFTETVLKESYKADNIAFKKVDLLDASKLVAIVKEYKVSGANECYVWKKPVDGIQFVNVAYGKDQELISNDDNKFIIIQPDSMSEDLLDMFGESELVVLK